jgi:hypothetical protein
MRAGRRSLVSLYAMGVLGALLLWPASSLGLVTLGSDLSHEAVGSAGGCGQMSTCTFSQTSLTGRLTASPVNGTVVTWRVRGAASDDHVRLRVLDPLGTASLFRSSSATEFVPVGDTISTFATSLPISIGDRIGVDDDQFEAANLVAYYPGPGGGFETFEPEPANGATASPSSPADFNGELLLNADIKPNTVFVIGRPFPLPGGVLKLKLNLPNPGVVVAGGAPKPQPPTSAQAAKARKLVKGIKKPVSAPGEVTLKLKPTKATRERLRRNGKASGKVTVIFTPTGGSSSSQTFKVKLKS